MNVHSGSPQRSGQAVPLRFERPRGNARRVLHKGEHLYRAGDAVRQLYVVHAGLLKSYRIDEDGNEQVLGFTMAGEACGIDCLNVARAPNNVIALDSTSLEAVPMHVGGELHHDMLICMSRELQRLARLLQLERCSAQRRVAAFLLEHAGYQRRRGCVPDDFVLPMPRRDLARYLHLATETVSRMLCRLQADGVIRVAGNHVRILDEQRLRAQAGALDG